MFLVVIMSARRMGEFVALRADHPFINFQTSYVVLSPSLHFLTKMVSRFHLAQDIVFPVFFSSPSLEAEKKRHPLDEKRPLLFFLDRIKVFQQCPHLFLCYFGSSRERSASTQVISRWIALPIWLRNKQASLPCHLEFWMRSTGTQAVPSAFQRDPSLGDICWAVTWASLEFFIKHYSVDINVRRNSAVGRDILLFLFH